MLDKMAWDGKNKENGMKSKRGVKKINQKIDKLWRDKRKEFYRETKNIK